MQKLIFTSFASALLAGSASAALTNLGFENGLTGWTFSTTTGAGTSSYGGNEFANPPSYTGTVAELEDDFLWLNTLNSRDYVVSQASGLTIAEGTWGYTVALGNRLGAAPTNFRDSPGFLLETGYLTTPGDLGTFMVIASTTVAEATINALADGAMDDFSVSSAIAGGNAAIGNEFAIRFTTQNSGTVTTGNGNSALQGGVDNIRVTIPEPSAAALLALGFAGVFARRRR